VHVDTDFTITGRLARFGRSGMIQDTSKRLFGELAACLQEELKRSGDPAATAPATSEGAHSPWSADAAPAQPRPATAQAPSVVPTRSSAPLSGLGLLLSVLRDRIRRLLARRRGSRNDRSR